jgi:hypothetical protein
MTICQLRGKPNPTWGIAQRYVIAVTVLREVLFWDRLFTDARQIRTRTIMRQFRLFRSEQAPAFHPSASAPSRP